MITKWHEISARMTSDGHIATLMDLRRFLKEKLPGLENIKRNDELFQLFSSHRNNHH
jgi:hypothetical protein